MKITTTLLLLCFSSASFASSLICFGNEPFWNLTIDKKGMVFQRMGEKKISIMPKNPMSAEGMTREFLRVYKTSTTKTKQPVTVIVQLAEKGCSDGMQDKEHRYYAIAVFPTEVFSGCCNPKNL